MHARGEAVTLYSFRRRHFDGYSGPVMTVESDPEGAGLRRLMGDAAIVVDSLLGTGQSRPAEGALARVLDVVAETHSERRSYLAVDIPTGVDADTGRVLGPAFRADATICMGFPKLGTVIYPGATFAGRLEIATLGIEPGLAAGIRTSIHDDGEIASLLPVRSAEGNKGASGRLLSIGGSADFVGAPMLVAEAAYRIGAGLVEIAIPASIRDAVSAHGLEPVYRRLPEEDGRIAPAAAQTVAETVERARAVAVGPGMGLSGETVDFMRRMLPVLAAQKGTAVIIDADGLNALAQIEDWWRFDFSRILTPHPGEMSRLTGRSIADIQADRLGVTRDFASRWNSVVLLKGAGTVIARPDGEAAINTTGGPNLATAGTGDVLSGIIGGLLAQRRSPYEAGVAGAYVHGRAGDTIAARMGDVGTIASDLLAVIPRVRRELSETGTASGESEAREP
jgi:NAD(P)H-hydrate epimerase